MYYFALINPCLYYSLYFEHLYFAKVHYEYALILRLGSYNFQNWNYLWDIDLELYYPFFLFK